MFKKATLLTATILATALWLNPSYAAAPDATASATKKNTEKTASAVEQAKADISGFRSAKFGMTEEEVRKAIKSDFKLADNQINKTTSVERNQVLVATVNDLMPESKAATVEYVFGYKSKKLHQVKVTWQAIPDVKDQSQRFLMIASSLSNFFSQQAFAPNTVFVNKKLGDGTILFFQGSDEAGHTVSVAMPSKPAQEVKGENKDGKEVVTPIAVVLSYIENIKTPDVFKIEQGQF